ncbi:MAG: dUMP phosphatase [Chloroflexi bacterium ADurb.Bin120]|nr:MAG: dUMP phosphatase [Chloroflexi bacterium ADurb.Bin120]
MSMNQPDNQPAFENIRCLLIDLDDTLYPFETGAWTLVGEQIDRFLVEVMGFPQQEVRALRARLFNQYGTTLRGLQVENEVDMDFYLDYVHDVPIADLLSPDPELNQVLHALPQRKVIFTNANSDHARRVLQALGVQEHFERIIDIYDIYPHCKPEIEAFHKALAIINEKPQHVLMIDDNPKNLAAAKSLGMATAIVGAHRHDGSSHLRDIKALARLLAHS